MLRYLYLVLFSLILLSPPMVKAEELTSPQILDKLEQNLVQQYKVTENLWGKYLILKENLKQEKGLSLVLDQQLDQATERVSILETKSSKQESQLMKASDYSKSLEKELDNVKIKLKIFEYSTIGLGVSTLVLSLVLLLGG